MTPRIRRLIVALLGRTADACVALASFFLAWQERIDPAGNDLLTPEASERIWAGVKARIEKDPELIATDPAAVAPTPFAEPFQVPAGTFICRFQGFH